MTNTDQIWDRVAEKYAKRPIKKPEAYAQTLDRTRSFLSRDDNVLEVGCGTGSTALTLAGNVNQITASDISAKMIEIGRGKAEAEQVDNVRFVQADLIDDTLEKGSYDVILAFNFLYLVEDTPAVIRDIHQYLKPGGLFISKTICFAEHSRFFWFLLYVMRILGIAPYVRFLKIRELEDYITDANFRIIETGMYRETPLRRFIVAKKI